MNRTTLPILLAAAVGMSACLDDSITGTRTLGVEVTTSSASVETGETVTATVAATGTGIQGMIVDWGDGIIDSLSLSGLVVTAESAFDHDYSASGSYTIIARVEDQSGAVTDSATVDVADPAHR